MAAQLHLDREHPNRLVFGPEAGLDPSLDVVLVGSELRVLIKGRASNWLNNVVITSSRTRAAASGATSRRHAARKLLRVPRPESRSGIALLMRALPGPWTRKPRCPQRPLLPSR